MFKLLIEQIPGIVIGLLVGGVASAVSSRYLGWFNKQIGSIRSDLGK
jgi:hypothetical protein